MTDETDPMVDRPDHYNVGGLEMFQIYEAKFSREEVRGHYKLNAVKYIFRSDHKSNPEQDIRKAIYYLERLLQFDKEDHNE